MTKRYMLAMIALVAMLAVVAVPAQQIRRLILKDGNTVDGFVTKTDEGYQVKGPSGVVVVFPADRVEKVEDIERPEAELEERLAKLKPDDVEGWYQLAVWAREKELPDKAKELLKKVLAIKPDHENAQLLLSLLDKDVATTGPVTPTPQIPSTGPGKISPTMLLTIEDVYRIRLMELRGPANPQDLVGGEIVPIRFRNDLLKRVVDDRLGPQFERPRGEVEFRGWSPMTKVKYILRETDERESKYRDDILITGDPERLKAFRSRIWPIIAGGCASTSCHGGAKGAGRLKFFTAPMTDDRVAYTNFYILHRWSRGGSRLINRGVPANSLLLECGLPEDVAKEGLGHPKKLDRPVYRNRTTDGNYKLVRRWIEGLKNPLLPPEYRIKYKLPVLEDKAPVPAGPAD